MTPRPQRSITDSDVLPNVRWSPRAASHDGEGGFGTRHRLGRFGSAGRRLPSGTPLLDGDELIHASWLCHLARTYNNGFLPKGETQ